MKLPLSLVLSRTTGSGTGGWAGCFDRNELDHQPLPGRYNVIDGRIHGALYGVPGGIESWTCSVSVVSTLTVGEFTTFTSPEIREDPCRVTGTGCDGALTIRTSGPGGWPLSCPWPVARWVPNAAKAATRTSYAPTAQRDNCSFFMEGLLL